MNSIKNSEELMAALRLRNKWLNVTIFSAIVGTISVFYFTILPSFTGGSLDKLCPLMISSHSHSLEISLLLLYIFAYRQYGTGWLTFCMAVQILGIVFSLVVIVWFLTVFPYISISAAATKIGCAPNIVLILTCTVLLLLLIDIAIGCWWLNLSFKLRKTNISLGFECSPEAQLAKTALRSATDSESLTAALEQATLAHPQYIPLLQRLYEERKLALNIS